MSFGTKFATPIEFCKKGYARIRAGLNIPLSWDEHLYAAFEEGHRSGNPRLQIKLLSEILMQAKWTWPWMERNAAIFEEYGMWPDDWTRRKIRRPLHWHDIAPKEQVEMVSIAMTTAAHCEVRKSQLLEPAIYAVFRPTLLATPPCRLEAIVVKHYRPRIESGDLSVVPPFYPGDRSYLTTERRARIRHQS